MNTSDPSAELLRLINGFQISQALHVGASLAVADHLKDGPKSAALSSRPEEFHLRALPEPCMTLSSHTAPDVRPLP